MTLNHHKMPLCDWHPPTEILNYAICKICVQDFCFPSKLDLKNRDLNVKIGCENSLFNHSHQFTTTICHKYELYGSEYAKQRLYSCLGAIATEWWLNRSAKKHAHVKILEDDTFFTLCCVSIQTNGAYLDIIKNS